MQSNKYNLTAQLISKQINIYYLTGFKGVSDTEKEAYLLIVGEKYYLFTSALYLEQANLQSKNTPSDGKKKTIRVIEISKTKPLSKQIKIILTKFNISALEFEPDSLTVSEFKKLKKDLADIRWRPIKSPVESQRQIKNSWEITQIQKAAKLTDQCFSYIVKQLKPKVTETQIAWKIEKFIREHGAQLAFSPIVAFGKNSSQPHYLSSVNCQLQTTDLVLLDFGAQVNGYCSDMTRVLFFGKPNIQQQKVYETVLSAQNKAINHITQLSNHPTGQSNLHSENSHILIYEKNKLSGTKLDRLAKDYINQQGFPPYQHSLGHGLGLDIHEAPRLTIKKDAKLKPGMVFTIEPAVYIPGQFGIRIEDTVLLKNDGLEILTQSPKELLIIQ